jgi:hypothetical protein
VKLVLRLKGGTGSGHYGHQGRPGKHGGSLPGVGSNPLYSGTSSSSSRRNTRRDELMDESDSIKEEYRRLRALEDRTTNKKQLISIRKMIKELNARQVELAEELKKL